MIEQLLLTRIDRWLLLGKMTREQSNPRLDTYGDGVGGLSVASARYHEPCGILLAPCFEDESPHTLDWTWEIRLSMLI